MMNLLTQVFLASRSACYKNNSIVVEYSFLVWKVGEVISQSGHIHDTEVGC